MVAVATKLIINLLLLPVSPKTFASKGKPIVPVGLAMRTSRAIHSNRWKVEHLAGRSLHSQQGTEVVSDKREGYPIRQVLSATPMHSCRCRGPSHAIEPRLLFK